MPKKPSCHFGQRGGAPVSLPRLPIVLGLAVALSWGLLSGCDGERCDEGQARVGSTCYVVELGGRHSDGAAAARDGAASDGLGSDGLGSDSAGSDGLGSGDGGAALAGQGEACKVDEDCAADVRYCLVMPAQPVGYCTKRDCDVALNDCPEGTQCIEVSRYAPGEPNLCVQM